uniref:Secreted protein n=1 Tax=Steinernema glaseri TaxID=37863 RepID=A0A1I7YK67_9BILA
MIDFSWSLLVACCCQNTQLNSHRLIKFANIKAQRGLSKANFLPAEEPLCQNSRSMSLKPEILKYRNFAKDIPCS